jgi:hypothetical protein
LTAVAVIYPYSSANTYLPRYIRETGAFALAVIPPDPAAWGMTFTDPDPYREWDGTIVMDASAEEAQLRLRGVTAVVAGDEAVVPQAEAIAAAMGCRGNNYLSSGLRTSKAAMQRAAQEARLRVPVTHRVHTLPAAHDAAASIGYPVIFKPTRSASSDGVALCHSKQELSVAYSRAIGRTGVLGSPIRAAVIQQYLRGTKWTVSSVSARGCHAVTDVWRENVIYLEGGGIAWDRSDLVASVAPGRPSQTVAAYALQVLRACGVREGPANVEIMLTAGGPYLIEMAARLSGCYPHDLVQDVLGGCQPKLAAEAALDPYAVQGYTYKTTADDLMQLTQLWFRAPYDAVLSRMITTLLEEIPCVEDALGILEPGTVVKRTVSTPTSPGAVALMSTSAHDIADAVNLIRLHEESGALYLPVQRPARPQRPGTHVAGHR